MPALTFLRNGERFWTDGELTVIRNTKVLFSFTHWSFEKSRFSHGLIAISDAVNVCM